MSKFKHVSELYERVVEDRKAQLASVINKINEASQQIRHLHEREQKQRDHKLSRPILGGTYLGWRKNNQKHIKDTEQILEAHQRVFDAQKAEIEDLLKTKKGVDTIVQKEQEKARKDQEKRTEKGIQDMLNAARAARLAE